MPANLLQTNRVRRFTFRKPLDAHFRGVSIRVLDLSETGARVTHREPLIAGLEGAFQVEVPSSRKNLTLRARVVWSRALRDGSFDTGLKIIDERLDRAADLLDHLYRLGSTEGRRLHSAGNKLRGTAGDLVAARNALDFLTKNRSASARWKRLVERDMTPSSGYPIEILAAWELLGRSVDVEVVARAQRESEPFVLDLDSLLSEDESAFELVEA